MRRDVEVHKIAGSDFEQRRVKGGVGPEGAKYRDVFRKSSRPDH